MNSHKVMVGSFCLLWAILIGTSSAQSPLKVVTTFSDYAAIAKEIGGDRVQVDYLSQAEEDPHFVPPKPSLALKLKDADLFVTTGLDLEMWAPVLLDKARNKKIMDGAIGYVTASPGIELLQKPTTALSRTEGDIHIYGNPHIHTSPINWKKISENILIGLKKVDPENSAYYEERQKAFVHEVDRSMFGDELVDLLGGETLTKMLLAGTLFDFLGAKEYQGEKLIQKLGGWLKEALPFRGKKIIEYHPTWTYFARDFGLEVVAYIEPKPGIPPSARHVKEVIDKIKAQNVELLLVATYFEKNSPRMIEERTGIKAVFLPLGVGGVPETSNNFELVDYWIAKLKEGFGMEVQQPGRHQHQKGQTTSSDE
ncbi:MAG: metal ABC transporter substrate-binding protein [candidate division KSB1 bacterium]|nr:metal ABC transporter substrate-binding protein [candidate division KSB1 bacterium]